MDAASIAGAGFNPVLARNRPCPPAVLLIAWRSHLTFFIDDWDLLLHRRGLSADVLLGSHARHLILGPAAALEGNPGHVRHGQPDSRSRLRPLGCSWPACVLLFVYVRRRVGDWLALAAVLPILFMGVASEDLLNVFQICYFGSMAFGIGALLVFEREETRGDVLTCLLLLASLAFAEIAFAFAVACAVVVALAEARWRRLWVIAVPFLLYLPGTCVGTAGTELAVLRPRRQQPGLRPRWLCEQSRLASRIGTPDRLGIGRCSSAATAACPVGLAALKQPGGRYAGMLIPLAPP